MTGLGIAFFLVLLYAFQTTLLPAMDIHGVHPDLISLTVVFVSFHIPGGKSVVAGGLLGLAQDALSGGVMGVNMLLKGFLGFGVAHLKDFMVFENLITQFFLIIGATVAEQALLFFVGNLLPTAGTMEGFWQDTAVLALYNALIGPPAYLLVRKMNYGRKNK